MKVLIIGGGGREHALAWKMAQSAQVTQVFVAPGNAGTAQELKTTNAPVAADNIPALLHYARDRGVGLTVVGPEAPLVAGIVDTFRANGLRILGPSQAAARLEGSKVIAKDFCVRHGIPSAAYGSFAEREPALAYLRQQPLPVVIKADGLAGGKGVVIAHTQAEAAATVEAMLSGKMLGGAGRHIVIEEFLSGEEASFMVLVDGHHILPLASSQDHKARDEGDQGPNTGGMGAYSPAPVVDPEMHEHILREVIEPTVHGLAAEGTPYTGFLYAGLMIGADRKPRVLEYNVRLGDPETQPILLRLRTDLLELCLAATEGRLDEQRAEWDPGPALGVVLTAGGYPGGYRRGDPISGLPQQEPQGTKIFHAGTALRDGRLVTDGGRVLCVTSLGRDIRQAAERAYAVSKRVRWAGIYYRRDIGHRSLARDPLTP